MVTRAKHPRKRNVYFYYSEEIEESQKQAIGNFVRLLYILLGKAENQRKYQKCAIIVIEEFDFRFHCMQSAIKVIRVKDKTRTLVPKCSADHSKSAIFIFGDETPLFKSDPFIFIEVFFSTTKRQHFETFKHLAIKSAICFH